MKKKNRLLFSNIWRTEETGEGEEEDEEEEEEDVDHFIAESPFWSTVYQNSAVVEY